jgi:ABC-2 type transport system permease protein
MIRSSLSAVPQRLPVLWSKAGVFLVLPNIMQLLPSGWSDAVSPYLPSNGGQQIMSIVRDPNAFSPWVGFAVLCG